MSDRHRQITALLSEGLTQAQIAKRLRVSPSTVSRVLANHRADDSTQPAMKVVDRFVASLGPDLEPDVAARCEALRVTAAKLDWSRTANTGTAAMAAPQLAREFDRLLEQLKRSASFDELKAALLAGDDA
jgi:transcriptional regulator with XRE-family HTH domain